MMYRRFLQSGQLLPALLLGTCMFFTPLLWSQATQPRVGLEDRIQLAALPEVINFQSSFLPVFSPSLEAAEQRAPLRLTGSYDPPMSKQPTFNLQRTSSMAEFLRNGGHFTGASNSWMKFNYSTACDAGRQPISGAANKGRQIPWAGPIAIRVSEQAKAHPHVTRVLRILSPKF